MDSSSSSSMSVISEECLVDVTSRKNRLMKRKSKKEKILITVIVILMIIIMILTIGTTVIFFMKGNKRSMCTSEQCILSAEMLLQSMDDDINPCDDFYAYACNNWHKENPKKEAEIAHSWFRRRATQITQQIKDILESNDHNAPHSVKETKEFYRSCLNTATLNAIGLDTMMATLKLLGLPTELPSERTTSDFHLTRTLALTQRILGIDILLSLSVVPDSRNSSRNLIYVSAPSDVPSGLAKVITTNQHWRRVNKVSRETRLKVVLDYIARIMSEVNKWSLEQLQYNYTDIRTMAFKTLLYDMSMHALTNNLKTNDNVGYLLTLQNLQEILDTNDSVSKNSSNRINVEEYISVLYEDSNIKIPIDFNQDIIVVSDIDYFLNISSTLADSQQVTIQRYIWWKVVNALARYTTSTMRDIRYQFYRHFSSHTIQSRSEYCVKIVRRFLPKILSYAISVKHPVSHKIPKIRTMVEDIREGFNTLVNDVSWLKEKTKLLTFTKAAAMKTFVGHSDDLLNQSRLDNHWQGFELNARDFLLNLIILQQQAVLETILSVREENQNSNENIWEDFDPMEVNAFYSRTLNAIVIPASILHAPFYDRGLEALNYGAIGTILGHELTHGFDSEGRKYDSTGGNSTSWEKTVIAAFEERAQCFVDQYNTYNVTSGRKIDGRTTLAENIADNGGVREAYLAYQRYQSRHGSEPLLPGLQHLSHHQLFFLSYANLWCEISPDSAYDDFVLSDEHSPPKVRVLGALRNMAEFADAWQCDVTTRMFSEEKCIIW